MAQIELVWDRRDLEYWAKRVPERALFKALKGAGNRAIRKLRTETKRLVRAQKNIKAKYLQERGLPLSYPRNATTIDGLIWRMGVSDIPVPLSDYTGVRQMKEGVSVQVNASGARKLIKSAFLAIKHSSGGGLGVFKRPGKERYPMGHLLGPNVADIVEHDPKLSGDAFVSAQDVFAKSFDYLIAKELKKRG